MDILIKSGYIAASGYFATANSHMTSLCSETSVPVNCSSPPQAGDMVIVKRINCDLLDALLQRLLVTKQGIELVNEVRDGEPLEPKPRVRAGRIRGVHVSLLMGFAVRLNDATLQSALLHELDDPHAKCLEY
ncbi:hypothetical protein HDG34_003896 [Paraburkholderia sp. HC6.4b]|uniref:hypothetical protein n=1 Tax=unclassified Paraburkholderia TaxID=2615204 RepID=UPI00160D4F0F|nr:MULTISPECIES: hypothetical protein [unclassified Paraburkholderia]MBB5409943.1 hypothetical protein [Paraburkholderia sp. HC6.4b]MBB5452142.1 hypothetical protein [Paraburkholderia sp. Kb1A]